MGESYRDFPIFVSFCERKMDMTVGGGETADQMVRMMLSTGEVAIRLSGSALKNMLALSMALARDHKRLSGKVNMTQMLRETRDLRLFPMTPEQFKEFQKHARKHKLLFSSIHDQDDKGKLVDVVLPVTELDRANMIFQRMAYGQAERCEKQREEPREQSPEKEKGNPEVAVPKKDTRSEQGLNDTRSSRSTWNRSEAEPTMTREKPSIEERLAGFRAQIDEKRQAAPTVERGNRGQRRRPKER